MSTPQQIEANRLNAQKSTGPRSAEGKAAVRFNALKSGIDAQSQVIPGEDPAALALLTAEYYDRYRPATPEVRALVDTLVTAEWLQRRFRTLEAQLVRVNIHALFREFEGLQEAQAYHRDGDGFDRLQRRINAVERSYHRALVALQKIESRPPQPDDPIDRVPDPDPQERRVPRPAPGPASEASIPLASGVRPPPLNRLGLAELTEQSQSRGPGPPDTSHEVQIPI